MQNNPIEQDRQRVALIYGRNLQALQELGKKKRTIVTACLEKRDQVSVESLRNQIKTI